MPLLTKKKIMKQRSTFSSQPGNTKKFKTPLLTQENISKILLKDLNESENVNTSTSSQTLGRVKQVNRNNTISGSLEHNIKNNASTERNLVKTKSNLSMNMHLSFENVSQKDSEATSDISFRMNEPKIKEAYFTFVKSLNQSSDKQSNITSSPFTQKHQEDVSFSKTSLQKVDESNFKKSTNKGKKLKKRGNKEVQINKELLNDQDGKHISNSVVQKHDKKRSKVPSTSQKTASKNQKNTLSPDSGISLSQEVLNQKKVKAAYIEFVKSQNSKEKVLKSTEGKSNQRKRNYFISSSSEEDVDMPIPIVNKAKLNKIMNKDKSSPLENINKKRSQNHKKTTKEDRKEKSIGKEKVSLKRKNTAKALTEDDSSNKKLTLHEKMSLIQDSRNVGLYVLCDICDKARYLPHVKDPLDLPDMWYCCMNPDKNYNECSQPEVVEEEDDYLIRNLYNAGSIVWARMDGYPWWPAMVEDDPDEEAYFWLEGNSMSPTWYHVTFFDSVEVTRAWMRPLSLKPFKINMNNPQFLNPENKYKSRVHAACKQACDAIELPLLDRLKKYSFINRYNKPLGKQCQKQKYPKKKVQKRIMQSQNKSILLSHNVESSEEKSLSLFSVNIGASPSTVEASCNDTETSLSKNNENQDVTEILNINWMDSPDLSFNLFD